MGFSLSNQVIVYENSNCASLSTENEFLLNYYYFHADSGVCSNEYYACVDFDPFLTVK